MKIKLLADSWRRVEKDEDGDKVKRRYRKGTVLDVNAAEARALLREGNGIRPMAEKVESTQAQPVQRTASASSDKK